MHLFLEAVRERGRRLSQLSLLLWPLQSQSEGRDRLHNNELHHPVQHGFSLSWRFPQELSVAPQSSAGTKKDEKEKGKRKQSKSALNPRFWLGADLPHRGSDVATYGAALKALGFIRKVNSWGLGDRIIADYSLSLNR